MTNELQREFDWFSYRLSHWTATVFLGTTILVPFLVMVALMALLTGAWFLDVGNHYLGGSASLDGTGWVLGIMNMVDAALVERGGLLLLSIFAIGGVVLTMEKHPLARFSASVGCIAVHLMLIGALL